MRHFAPLLLLVILAGCVDRLPDQDLRILSAAPVAKMSVDLLWKEYRENASAANRKYKGEVVEITGQAKNMADGPDAWVDFPQAESGVVKAHLLTEQAAAILAAAPNGRMTLRCYVQGLEGALVLRSCIKP